MSILTLLIDLKISAKELNSISAKEIIRIEKLLKSKLKIDNSIDINEIERCVYMLKNNAKELSLLFDYELQPLKYILQSSTPKMLSISRRVNKYDQNFKDFLNTNFKSEIDLYISNCFKEDHYRALHSLLQLQLIFDYTVIERITQDLHKKIDFGAEYHFIHNREFHTKAKYFTNPFFFRSLNLLTPSLFENKLINLLILIDKKYKSQKDVYLLKILFSISEFSFIREDLKDFVVYIKQVAIDKGIIEVNYGNSKEKNQKGGTRDGYEKDILLSTIIITAILFISIIIAASIINSSEDKSPSMEITTFS